MSSMMNRLLSLIFLLLPFLAMSETTFDSPDNVASTEGLPNNLVNGCVCAISGEFVQSITEFVIPGPEPLVHVANYGSRFNWGWSWVNFETIRPFAGFYEGRTSSIYSLRQPSGAHLFYYTTEEADKVFKKTGKLEKKLIVPKGLSNGGTLQSGRTNLKKQKLTYRKETKEVTLEHPSGSQTLFSLRFDSEGDAIFRVKSISKINGSKYEQVKSKKSGHFLFLCKNQKTNKLYNHVQLECTEKDGEFHQIHQTSDGRTIKHYFIHRSYHVPAAMYIPGQGLHEGKEKHTDNYLKKIVSTSSPQIEFDYEEKAVGKQYQIKRKRLPDHRFLEIEYYKKGTNRMGGQLADIKIDHDSDYRVDRVKRLKAPVGTKKEAITTHSFIYSEETKTNDQGIKELKSGKTTIYDAYDHKMRYEYDKYCRLTSITRYTGTSNYHTYSKDLFSWGKEGAWDEGHLLGKILMDRNDQVYSARFFAYDQRGNLRRTSLCGSLTGESISTLSIDKNLQPIGTYESENKTYTYTSQFNLLQSETDSSGVTIIYEYKPGTDWLTAKFTKWSGKIRLREFYKYDENGVVTLKVVDDGVETNIDNLRLVKVRRITKITPLDTAPIGLPKRIEECYADPATLEETLLGAVEFEYDLQGHPTVKKVFDANDQHIYTLTWKYDDHGNVRFETNAIGQTTERKYDDNDNLIYEKGPSQKFYLENSYDYSNRPIQQKEVHADGNIYTTNYDYNYLNQCTKKTDPFNNETTYEYDDFGRLTCTYYPKLVNEEEKFVDHIIRQEHDLASYVVKAIDPKERFITTERNIRGQPTKITYPDETCETFTYRLDGKLKSKTEKTGSKMVYTLDPLGRIKQENFYSPEGKLLKRSTHVYDSFHLIRTIDPEGLVTNYSYDKAGRLEWVREGHRAKQHLYDPMGRLCEEREWFGEAPEDYCSTITLYDLLDRVIENRMEDSSGTLLHLIRYGYDEAGNCNFEQIGDQVTQTEYNAFNEPIKIINAMGEETHMTYDRQFKNHNGQKVLKKATRDPFGTQTIEIYDTANRPVEISSYNPFGEMISRQKHFLDLCGNPVKIIDFQMEGIETKKKIETLRAFSPMDEETLLWEAHGTPEQKITKTEYNCFGQKSLLIKPDGNALAYAYNPCGLLLSLKSSDQTISYLYSYNKNDQVTKVQDLITNKATERIYSKLGELETEKLANGLEISYAYDGIGRRRLTKLPGHTIEQKYNACYLKELLLGNQLLVLNDSHSLSGKVKAVRLSRATIHYEYDQLDRCTSIRSPFFNQTIPEGGYDKAGNLRRFTLQNINYHFDYDDLYQLTAESGHTLHRYSFDSLSNRKEKDIHKEKHNNLHQLLVSGEESFDYDLNGNMSKRIKDGIETIYTHDALDRLSTVTSKGKKFTYNYDAFNRRIAKISPDKEELFLYQDQEEIGIVENGTIRQLKLGAKEGSGSMLVIELDGQLYYPIKDLFGNVSTLLNSEGKTVESYRYTAFGEMEILAPTDTILTSSVIGNPWRYAGKRVDPDTSLISFGLRDYDSSLGRWMTPDPAGFGDGPNLYAYVHNRPLVLFDSYGLFSMENNDSSPTFEGSQESMWNRTCGGLHGALDFCLNQCYGLGSDCCIYGTGLNEDMLSFDERWNAFTSYEETQAQFSMDVERGIQNFLQVDENCAAYQDSRQITTATLEFASLAAGAYGLSRGLLAGGRSLIRTGANQTGYRRLFSKPMEQIAKNEAMLFDTFTNKITFLKKGIKPRVNKLTPHPEAQGAHSSFKRDPITNIITGYETYELNPVSGKFSPLVRFRGRGKPHGGIEPPFILERRPGKGIGSEPVVPRKLKSIDKELPYGY